MAIITISRQIGSLGEQIAKSTADKLGYRYIEKNQISEALSSLGFSVADVDKYDEKKPSVWQTLSTQKRLFALLIRAAIYELAAHENVVIVGRGGQVILKDIPEVFHVRIIAPYASRVSRLIEQKGYEEKKAQVVIRQSDRDSSGYLNTYFDADWDDSDLYDLIINTRAITLDKVVELITCAVGTHEIKKSASLFERLNDLSLTQKARASLLEIAGMELVNVVVEKGVGSLSGLVRSSTVMENCEKAISNIKGITSVNNQLNVASENTKIF